MHKVRGDQQTFEKFWWNWSKALRRIVVTEGLNASNVSLELKRIGWFEGIFLESARVIKRNKGLTDSSSSKWVGEFENSIFGKFRRIEVV